MLIYPAIDLRGGRVVRLTQGDYDRRPSTRTIPAAVAQRALCRPGPPACTPSIWTARRTAALRTAPSSLRFARCRWRSGRRRHAHRSRRGRHARPGRGPGDPWHRGGGGFRHGRAVGRALGRAHRRGRGRARRQGGHARLARGEARWTAWPSAKSSRTRAWPQIIYTDIGRDGALSGTNLDIYERLFGIAGLQVIASGGVSFETEIAALRDMGLYGCILGKALYAGKLRLERALAIAREAQPC